MEILLSPNIRAPPANTYFAATTLLSAHPKCDAGASLQDVLMGLLHSGVIRPLSGVIGRNWGAFNTVRHSWVYMVLVHLMVHLANILGVRNSKTFLSIIWSIDTDQYVYHDIEIEICWPLSDTVHDFAAGDVAADQDTGYDDVGYVGAGYPDNGYADAGYAYIPISCCRLLCCFAVFANPPLHASPLSNASYLMIAMIEIINEDGSKSFKWLEKILTQ